MDVALHPFIETIYNLPVSNGLVEHEFNEVFIGSTSERPDPNPSEVDRVRWSHLGALKEELKLFPERFSPWFRVLLPRVLAKQTRLATSCR